MLPNPQLGRPHVSGKCNHGAGANEGTRNFELGLNQVGKGGDATSSFRTGPLKGLTEVEEIVFDWVSWYNNERLHSFLGNIPPEEYEHDYYARNIGTSTSTAANKTAA